MTAPNFWDNQETAKATIARLKSIKSVVEPLQGVLRHADDLGAMVELLEEADDDSVRQELDSGLHTLESEVGRIELLTLLSGPHDTRNCYFNIQAGTGGADACDWAQ